jgi:hypothetical protein
MITAETSKGEEFMELEREERLVAALRREGVPARGEHTGGGVFVAEVDLGDGTLLQIGEDEGELGWQRTDGETGELVGESAETPGEFGHVAAASDMSGAVSKIHELIQARGWTPIAGR